MIYESSTCWLRVSEGRQHGLAGQGRARQDDDIDRGRAATALDGRRDRGTWVPGYKLFVPAAQTRSSSPDSQVSTNIPTGPAGFGDGWKSELFVGRPRRMSPLRTVSALSSEVSVSLITSPLVRYDSTRVHCVHNVYRQVLTPPRWCPPERAER